MSHRRVRAVLLAAALPLVSSALAAGELATSVGALSDGKLGAPCVAVRDGKLAHADLEIALGNGIACPVLAGDAKIGWFYSGEASFRYLSRDRVENAVLRFNAKSEGRVAVKDVEGGSLAITGKARTVLFAASSGSLPALPGTGAEAPVSAFQKHRAEFARYGGLSMPHLFAAAALDRWTTAAVRVELGEGDGPLLYTFEPTDGRSESLEILGEYTTSDREVRRELRSTVLSEQPIARDRRLPVPAPFAVTAVDYELTATNGDTVAIKARTTVVAARDGIRVLRFSIPGRILTSSGPGDSSERTYRIASVMDAKGNPLEFDQGREDVIVDLARSARKAEAMELVFRVEGNFLVRPNGDNYWILEGEEIFPQPAPAGAQYTTHGIIRVKKPFVAFASGATVRRSEDGEDNVVEVRSDLPTDLPAVVAGRYASSEATRDGLTVRVATYAAKNARSQEQLTELTFGMIRHFEKFLGPFPNSEFNIVQVNDLGWGQAPLGMMLITNEAFDLLLPEDLRQIYTEGINERFAHEIAHQWWGHAVRSPNSDERWLSESFAEYSAGLMVKRAQGKGTFDNLKASWKTRGKEASHVAPIALADRITIRDVPTFRTYRVGLLYAKGPWLLSRLHDEIGDEKFLTFLKSYQKSLRGKCGSTTLAVELLRVLTGKDYGPFFEANFWGTGMPN
jgi:hypothetical protein